ncbi:MAG: heme o synthase [Pirellulales bacterium]
MSMTALSIDERRGSLSTRVADYVELTKPRISAMVLVTVGVAALVADWGPPGGWLLLHTLLGTALIAASASAFNQILERETDARMERTRNRPLPAGRLSVAQVATFGGLTLVLGFLELALAVKLPTLWLGLLTWFLYVCVYTPLKTRTSANTAVGAVAGALPVLMGFSAVGAPLDLRAWSMFLIVFLWQFPHFMAIAWMYRQQYAAAGLKMLSVVDASGHRAAAQALIAALVLIPVSLVPCLWRPSAELYFVWAVVFGLAQLACAVGFLMQLSDASARRLLFASLVYLPAMMGLLLLGPLA